VTSPAVELRASPPARRRRALVISLTLVVAVLALSAGPATAAITVMTNVTIAASSSTAMQTVTVGGVPSIGGGLYGGDIQVGADSQTAVAPGALRCYLSTNSSGNGAPIIPSAEGVTNSRSGTAAYAGVYRDALIGVPNLYAWCANTNASTALTGVNLYVNLFGDRRATSVTNWPSSQAVTVGNWPSSQTVNGTVNIGTQPIDVACSNCSPAIVGDGGDGHVTVDNWPSSLPVDVANWPASVSGSSVAIDCTDPASSCDFNFPSTVGIDPAANTVALDNTANVVALDTEDSHRLDLVWWGLWGLVGLALVSMIAERWYRAWSIESKAR
jgi:hypothetical protein